VLNEQGACTTLSQRRELAARAFGVSSHYDTAIKEWFEENM
jgi:phosphoribosylaminoimidazolecarboxamide formyltransferase/IMP cyclohydrolase